MKGRDPYLIPGQVCYVFYVFGKLLAEFIKYENDIHIFEIIDASRIGCKVESNNYNPIGTEWDYIKNHPQQEKFLCSTVDKNGKIYIWNTTELYPAESGGDYYINRWHSPDDDNDTCMVCVGYCPDKSRYQGDAWKTSLRMRPEWAKVG